jgi:hypothetical protein
LELFNLTLYLLNIGGVSLLFAKLVVSLMDAL